MLGLLPLILAILAILAADDAAAPPKPGGILAGPAVTAPAAPRVTVVERGFDGALLPLDDEPEVVAAFRVVTDPARRERLDAAAAARTAAFESILFEHYDAITGLGDSLKALKGGTPEERVKAVARLREVNAALAPFRARGTFADDCGGELTSDEVTEVRRLASEWRAARAAELRASGAAADAVPGDPPPAGERFEARIRMEETGAMVRRAIQRRASSRTAQFDHLAKELDLTPEQAERVRGLFMEFAVQEIQGKRERGSYSRREQQQVFGELAKILDERQRLRLGELLTGMPAGER